MTKSITIQYLEADELLLMGIFKKFKVKIFPTAPNLTDDEDEEGVPLEVALDMVEAWKWIKQVERGEADDLTWEDMMAELEADKMQEVAVAV